MTLARRSRDASATIVTDTLGNMLEGVVHGADVQDRDGAAGLIARACETYPTLVKVRRWRLCRQETRSGGHAHQPLVDQHHQALRHRQVRRSAPTLDRRTHPGMLLNRVPTSTKDWEASIAHAEAWRSKVISSIRRMTRRIAKLECFESGSKASARRIASEVEPSKGLRTARGCECQRSASINAFLRSIRNEYGAHPLSSLTVSTALRSPALGSFRVWLQTRLLW